MSEYVTREQFEAAIRARIRAYDRGLSAMLVTIERELPNDPRGVEQARDLVASIRTNLCAKYPFAVDAVGTG
jgi:hypothetical protein